MGVKPLTWNIFLIAIRHRIQSDMVSIKTHGDRTLFFDFLPFDLGTIQGYRIKTQLYTVPGQVKYNATRKLVLKGVDGVVFVADSMVVMREKNIQSLENLRENLAFYDIDLYKFPVVLQYNKRDLNAPDIPHFGHRDPGTGSQYETKGTLFRSQRHTRR